MSYTLKIIKHEFFLHLVLQGSIEKDAEADKMQEDLIEQLRQHPFKTKLILLDVRDLVGRGSVTNTFFRASSVPNDIKMLRIALLENSENAAKGKIAETMYKNSGTGMQLFTDYYKAEEWLNGLKVLGFA